MVLIFVLVCLSVCLSVCRLVDESFQLSMRAVVANRACLLQVAKLLLGTFVGKLCGFVPRLDAPQVALALQAVVV